MELPQVLKRVPAEFWHVLGWFVLTRVALTCIALVMLQVAYTVENPSPHALGIPLLDLWGQWDAKWYLQIAETGYSAVLQNGEATYAFYPFYPVVIRLMASIVGNTYVAGLLVSNIALLAAGVLLYRLVRLDADRQTALRSAKYLFLYPAGYFFSSVMTEGLFIMLAIACFYAARKERWWLAGLLGVGLALTKFIGVFIVIPLAIEYVQSRNWQLNKARWNALGLALPLLGHAAFMAFLWRLTGDWFAYAHIMQSNHNAYGHYFANPLSAVREAFTAGNGHVVAGLFAIIAFVLLIAGFRALRRSYWVYGMIAVFVPLFAGMIQARMGRYVAIVFPLFILFAAWSGKKEIDQPLTVALALLQGFFMAVWSIGGLLT